jgi:CubicO group peptidase (beta-lactamase class C family)
MTHTTTARTLIVLVVLASVSLGAQAGRTRTATARGFTDAGKAALTAQLTGAVDRGDAPGIAALVVNRDGVLFKGAAGKLDVARGVPMPADAIFNIASMTKPVTSVAVMMLVEAGKVKLDDPISKYLDGYAAPQVITTFNAKDGSYQTRPAKTPITIRHLLTNTSGIGYAFTNPIEFALVAKTGKGEWELPLLSEPGAQWHYGASTRVLGHLIEKLTGENLERWYQQHIFGPLGMVDTSYAVPAAKQSRVVTRYTRFTGTIAPLPAQAAPTTPTPPIRGDGGLFSTVEDYGRFVRMLLNEGTLGNARILSAASVKTMGQNHIGAIFVERQPDADKERTKPFPLGAGKDTFGLGFQIAANDPAAKAYRRPGSLSWAGLFNTEFWIDPAEGIGGIHMMQMLPFYDDGAIRALRGFEEAVYTNLR